MPLLCLLPLVLLVASLVYEALASHADRRRNPPPGRLVDLGGYGLHLNATGAGAPVVVLDAGLGDSSLVWATVQPQLATTARVASYDRAGIAWSDPSPRPRSARRAVDELHALLRRAGEPPPYVLVGHSSGVNHVRLFAETYPDAVAGLVLIEPPILAEASPVLVAALIAIRTAIGLLARIGVVRLLGRLGQMRLVFGGASPPAALAERAGFLYRPASIRASLDETRALPETIRLVNAAARPQAWRDWPVVILAAQRSSAPGQPLVEALHALARLSARGRVVFVPSSHFVHFERPDVVVATVSEVVQAACASAAPRGPQEGEQLP